MMKQETQTTQNPTTQNHLENGNWTFMAIRKECVVKRTSDYVLIKVRNGGSVILNAKFVRAKESETMIYVSVPNDYDIKLRYTKFDEETERYVVVKERIIHAPQLHTLVKMTEKELKTNDVKDVLAFHDFE